MIATKTIDLATANAILAAVIGASRRMHLKPMTMCVLDPGGHLVAMQREDHSGILRFEIAFGKAWASLGMGHATRYLQENLAKNRPRFVDALAVAADGRFIPVLGGALIRDADGTICGALGVTGDSAENDEIVALEAIEACGLQGDPN